MTVLVDNLNAEQSAAVVSKAPRRLVIAGPGSGKTRTLIAAIRHAIEEDNVPPGQVCVVSYTNAAADEIQTRVSVEPLVTHALGFCGTLHALMLRLIQEHHDLVGLPDRVSVLDDDQLESVINTIVKEMGIRVPVSSKVLPLLARADLVEAKPGVSRTAPELAVVEVHKRLRRAGLLTFDAILHYGFKVVNAFKNGTAGEHEWPFTHAFCDEVQDNSPIDWLIYCAMPVKSLFVVGDPDQSIFAFRGARCELLVTHANDAGEPSGRRDMFDLHTLETNYRSGSAITTAAQRLIEYNANRVPKRTLAAREGGTVETKECANPAAEMAYVVKRLSYECAEEPPRWNECAVLARTNWLANAFAEYLQGVGIPVARRKSPSVPGDWKKAKLLLTVLANPWSDFAVLQYLSALDAGKAAKVKAEAAQRMVGVNELLGFEFGNGEGTYCDADFVRYGLSMESRERIGEAAYELDKKCTDWKINDLLLALRAQEQSAGEVEGEGVYVGSIHSAKGREWSVVFLVGCEEKLLPSGKAGTDVEEERRLCYVGITRAKDRCVMSWCKERPQHRGANIAPGPPEPRQRSRFVTEAGL